MKNNFQTILLGIFLAFFVFAVFIFSGILPIGEKNNNTSSNIVGDIVVWGTFPEQALRDLFDTIAFENRDLNIRYQQKDPNTYQRELLSAFANDEGPDLFFVSNHTLVQNQNFIYQIPYTSYPKKIFQDTFVNGADIYIGEDGIDALPIILDPLVLYYNKSLLSNAGIAIPPVYWDQLFEINNKLTKKREDGSILQSMIALGTYENIRNAKDIISMLFIQSGNKIISKDGDDLFVDFDSDGSGLSTSINDELVNFYTGFSNPLESSYSWNRGLIDSQSFFTGNSLAFYIGHASELFEIEEINPNLSFDVTEIMQIRNNENKITSGDIYALAVNKNSKNLAGAFATVYSLSSSKYVDLFAKSLSLPPAIKANLAENPTDPYIYTFYKTAISLKTWLDPNRESTDDIFNRFINNVISGRTSATDSLTRLQSELNLLVK